jgi:hypothetical protein
MYLKWGGGGKYKFVNVKLGESHQIYSTYVCIRVVGTPVLVYFAHCKLGYSGLKTLSGILGLGKDF